MVYHLFERLFSPENLKINGSSARVAVLVQEGFTQAEAEQIAWLQNHQVKGKIFGLVLGGFSVYCCSSYIALFGKYFPTLRYLPMAKGAAQLATLVTFYKLGDYVYTSRRYGSNDNRTNGLLYSNRYYTDNKEALIQNFEPLNRAFTSEEVEQFLANQVKDENAQRNWIYNPHLHGESEEEWRAEVKERFQSGIAPWDRPQVREQILINNKKKIAAGEEIAIKPFNAVLSIDKTGLLHRLHPNFTQNFTILG